MLLHRSLVLLATALAGLPVLFVGVAQSTPPGRNGPLAFELYREATGFQPQIATMRGDGTRRRILTRPMFEGSEPAPDWSPNGRRIAFNRCTGEVSSCNIWTMRRDGSGKRQVTHCRPRWCFGNFSPAWAPNGRLIVFERDQRNARGENRPGLFVIRPDGSGLRRLTHAPTSRDTSDTEPQYSPRGRWIVFTRLVHNSDAPNRLMIVRATGGRPHRLTNLYGENADWSPDGRLIVFSGHALDDPDAANVYVIRPNGTGLRQLTHSPAGKAFDFYASWSPDGTRIVFNHADATSFDLYTMNRWGNRVRRITQNPNQFEVLADWGPRPRPRR